MGEGLDPPPEFTPAGEGDDWVVGLGVPEPDGAGDGGDPLLAGLGLGLVLGVPNRLPRTLLPAFSIAFVS